MTNKVLGGGSLDGSLGLNPDFSTLTIPLGRVVQSVDNEGYIQYWIIEETLKAGGNALANGLYANSTTLKEVAGGVSKLSVQNRQAIEAAYKAQGYNNVFFFGDGFTYTEPNDIGIYEDGTAWTYADAGALPVTVAAGTVPSEGVYRLVRFNAAAVTSGLYGDNFNDGEVVNTIAFYDGELSGGGAFKYDASKPKSEHNGIDVISSSIIFDNLQDWWSGVGDSDPSGSGCFVRSNEGGLITASQCGLSGESLYDSTQLYKLVNYAVKRWTQNQDAKTVLLWFADSDRYNTFKVDSKIIYVSGVINKDWSNKTLKGVSRSCSGIIQGNFSAADGTKHWTVKDLGFYGKIGLFDVPLPITGSEALKDDPAYFYVGDASSFGWGFGVGGAATTSSTGNTDDIVWENCYFEMRGGIISGGSAPDDEDRPKVTNVVFRNNYAVNNFYHGAAGIHFQGMKIYNNLWVNQYYGYAIDFSLGCVDCEAYNNTSLGLCSGGGKAEARGFPNGNRGCVIRDNNFAVDGSNGFNLVSRLSGAGTVFKNNTVDIYNYSGGDQDTPLISSVSPNAVVTGNTLNIHSVNPDTPLKTILTMSEEVISNYPELSLNFSDNTVNNFTNQVMSVVNIGVGNLSSIKVDNNKLNGKFDQVTGKKFTDVNTTLIGDLSICGNTGDLGTLFFPSHAVTIDKLVMCGNKGEFSDDANNNRLVSLSFTTINEAVTLSNNELSSTANFSAVIATSGCDMVNASMSICNNKFSGLTGAIAYMFQSGVDVAMDRFNIQGNDFTFSSADATAGVRIRGASTFTASGNTVVNNATSGSVRFFRPSDSDSSQLLYNIFSGDVTDNPLV